MIIFWLALFVILLIIEIITVGLATIWFAGGSMAALIVAAVGGPVWLQVILFFVVSFVLLFFTRPWAVKYCQSSWLHVRSFRWHPRNSSGSYAGLNILLPMVL